MPTNNQREWSKILDEMEKDGDKQFRDTGGQIETVFWVVEGMEQIPVDDWRDHETTGVEWVLMYDGEFTLSTKMEGIHGRQNIETYLSRYGIYSSVNLRDMQNM